MPMTISYLNILNNQPPAKRFQDTVVENSTNTNLLLHPQPDMFTTEQYDKNGSCFIWSSNLLVYGAWLQFNCSTKVSHPFIICEKNLNVNLTLQLFKRPSDQCTPRFLEFNGYCIKILKRVNANFRRLVKPKFENAILMRILTAWTMPLYIGQKRKAIHIVKWREKDKCECYSTYDTIYMENKTWSNNYNCNCNMTYSSLMVVPQTKAVNSKQLFSCKNGNFKQAVYQCNGEIDCQKHEDEQNCPDICSTYNNCFRGCALPDCTCTQLYHQCNLGGCVHQTFVCDGIVHCPADDSDELMCQYQISKSTKKKRLFNGAFSLCNSFSNETYPNNEICLLTRDQYGVTEHCSNTEHLRYCVDFRCPNHFKCFESYCIPLHLVCDGVEDCPTGQDEEHCGEFSCQGYFQCKGTRLCLHLNYLCDGVVDCPVHQDDEQYCDNFQCPTDCQCMGFTVDCIQVTISSLQYILKHKNRKVIILSSKRAIVNSADIQFSYFPWLLVLNLTGTWFAENLYPEVFNHMPQLRILDLTNVRIVLVKGSTFRNMNFLKHLYLIHSETFRLYTNTFQLPSLVSLHLQQSRINYIQNGVFCCLPKLRTINLSYNNIEHISVETFESLNGLHNLDLSHNNLITIEKSSLGNIAVVWFTGHITICCYVGLTSSCQLDQKELSRAQLQSVCQSILSGQTWTKVLYAIMGSATTLLSIIFLTKLFLNNEGKKIKACRFIKTIALIDSFNGIYILIVLASDLLNEVLAYRVAQRNLLGNFLFYLAAIPRISMITTRFEHLLLTVGMYVATCHVFSEFDAYIRVARMISWLVCLLYSFTDIFLFRHIALRPAVMWQPYQQTDYSAGDLTNIVLLIVYDLAVCIANILLCTRIYNSVKRNETRIQAIRIQKHYIVAKRLTILTTGRVLTTLLSVSLVVSLNFFLGLSIVVKEVLIALVVPSSTILNCVMFYNYVQ